MDFDFSFREYTLSNQKVIGKKSHRPFLFPSHISLYYEIYICISLKSPWIQKTFTENILFYIKGITNKINCKRTEWNFEFLEGKHGISTYANVHRSNRKAGKTLRRFNGFYKGESSFVWDFKKKSNLLPWDFSVFCVIENKKEVNWKSNFCDEDDELNEKNIWQ